MPPVATPTGGRRSRTKTINDGLEWVTDAEGTSSSEQEAAIWHREPGETGAVKHLYATYNPGTTTAELKSDATFRTIGSSTNRWTNVYANTINVSSAAVVANLNASLLEGNAASAFALSGHNHSGVYAEISGTPADNQVGVWTGATGLEGTAGLLFDSAAFELAIVGGANPSIRFDSTGSTRDAEITQNGNSLQFNENGVAVRMSLAIDTGVLTSLRYASTQTTGTAPFTVASTTVVANLNASLLEGNAASAFALAPHAHSAADITSGTLAVAQGGTNIGSYTIGDLLYASAAGVLSALGAGTATHVLTSNGAGVAPSWQAAAGGGVDTAGTPVDDQIAVFTDVDTIEGSADFTFGEINSADPYFNLGGADAEAYFKLGNDTSHNAALAVDQRLIDFGTTSTGAVGTVTGIIMRLRGSGALATTTH
ncbi:MAG TPA: hypothetical protein VMY98_02365, partial [Anaerolineae bacterium]|nr:hypothetical protein [Anaerolineae bacterium]